MSRSCGKSAVCYLTVDRVITTSKATTTGTTTIVEPASSSLTTTTISPTITAINTLTVYSTTSTSTSTSTITLTGSTVYTTGYPTVCTSLKVYARDDSDVLAPRSSIAKPACFSAYTSGALLSSACSCLSIATPTLTVTASHGITVTSTSSGYDDVCAYLTQTVHAYQADLKYRSWQVLQPCQSRKPRSLLHSHLSTP